MACGTFVVQCSRINPIGSGSGPGDGLSSKEMRSSTQRKLLDYRLQGAIYIVRLRGHLFFGNAEHVGNREKKKKKVGKEGRGTVDSRTERRDSFLTTPQRNTHIHRHPPPIP